MKKFEIVNLGQKIFKFKVSQELVDRLNNKMDAEIENNTSKNYNTYLTGKIKNEYDIITWFKKEDIDDEFDSAMNIVINDSNIDKRNWINISLECNHVWINDQKENEYQAVHTHYGASAIGFSIILFLKIPNFGPEFSNTDRPMNGRTSILHNGSGMFARQSHTIDPVVGDLYVFPYDVQHCVYPFTGSGIRRSLSANFDLFYQPKKI